MVISIISFSNDESSVYRKSHKNLYEIIWRWWLGWKEFMQFTRDSTVTGPQTVFWTGLSVCAHTLSLLNFYFSQKRKIRSICNNMTQDNNRNLMMPRDPTYGSLKRKEWKWKWGAGKSCIGWPVVSRGESGEHFILSFPFFGFYLETDNLPFFIVLSLRPLSTRKDLLH